MLVAVLSGIWVIPLNTVINKLSVEPRLRYWKIDIISVNMEQTKT